MELITKAEPILIKFKFLGGFCVSLFSALGLLNKGDHMSVFINITPRYLADKIHSAGSRVIYVSPGLNEVIASALINISKSIGVDKVSVLLDVSESVLCYGYGNIDGITLLKEKQ
ncbi:MAG: hypothetical protein U9N77_01095 [Thermodesulfobacteriota bacterium]|nr:hypothetical protein [Thermodesulfobacteriota bacterium]